MALIYFPIKGLHKGYPASVQPPNTTPDCSNARPFAGRRFQGGQRPGLKKWGNGDQIGGAEQPVVAMCTVSTVTS